MRYVRLEYTGFAFDEEHEANGISFYGVGNGTTVEYCEAYMGSDDSFDWTEGWNGTAKSLVAYQEAESILGYDCDCLIESATLLSAASLTVKKESTLIRISKPAK